MLGAVLLNVLLWAHPAAHQEEKYRADVHEQQEGACNRQGKDRSLGRATVVEHGDCFLVNRECTYCISCRNYFSTFEHFNFRHHREQARLFFTPIPATTRHRL